LSTYAFLVTTNELFQRELVVVIDVDFLEDLLDKREQLCACERTSGGDALIPLSRALFNMVVGVRVNTSVSLRCFCDDDDDLSISKISWRESVPLLSRS